MRIESFSKYSIEISMKKIYLFCILFVTIKTLFGQVVFSDNFNTSTGATYSTTPGAIGSSAVWNFNRSGVDFGTRIDGGILDCTNDGSATANALGWVFGNTSTGSFTSPYNTTLNANTSKITWTFNMRQIRADPAGFGSGSYGVAFILTGSSATGATAGSGYAVALGQSGALDTLRLVKYNNGMQGAVANIIKCNTAGLSDFGAEYLSIKVTYIPSTNTWELFVRNDGITAFADPTTGVLTSQGTAVDNTYTAQVLGFMGGYWQGNTGATQTAFFDNINVSLASTNSANSDIIADGSFTPPTNINYSLYQGTVLTLANSIEIARFTIRDGGGVADADVVGTTLNSISFSLSNSANIRRVAIMDGSTQLQELIGAPTITFSHPNLATNLIAPDDGSKNFSLRVVFANNVTDNQQYQFAVTSVTADVAGSQFAASNAGGATSSITGDNNSIEVIADGLSYVTNTFSPTGNGVAMAPAVEIGGTDTLNFGGNLYTNLDADFTEQINITSTGTLTGSPVTVTAVGGIANFSGLIHTLNGTAFTLTAERTILLDWDAVSNPFDIINASNTTDHFRSVQNGNWNNPTTWESSPDNIGWQPSTLTPNSLANTITIRNTDTVTITTNTDADQLSIENGGKLIQNNTPIFTINNGSALYDMTVEIGGTFEMNGRQPIGAGSIIIAGGGRIRVASNPFPSEADDFAFGNMGGVASVTFLNTSFYDWATTSTPSWTNRTYFTSGNNTYFTFLVTPGFSLGGGGTTVINGTLVANDTITIVGTGTKTFVNGIINAGLIDASFATGGSLNITGTGAALGDTGLILLPPAGLNIGASTIIGCTTDPATPTKTINGNVNFLANSYLFLTDTDLTITGNITGTSSTAFFITNGLSNAGKLFRPNIGVTPVSFPIGFNAASYNPVIIANGSNLNYGAKVFNDIVPTPIFDNTKAVNRTWLILPSGIPAGAVDVTFSYGPGEGNTNFNYTSNVELGLYTGVWNIIQTGILPSGTYNVATSVSAFGTGIEAPLVIGNLGAILSVQKNIQLTAVNQNNTVKLNWTTTNIATIKQFIIEYSSNGINYFPLATKNSSTFSFVDDRPLNQKNYYRIKGIGLNNSIVYSNIISINNNSLTSVFLTPSSTTSSITLNANSNKQQTVQLVLLDAVGKQLEQQTTPLAIGQNRILKNVEYLSKGIYYMVVYYSNGDKTTLRFVKM